MTRWQQRIARGIVVAAMAGMGVSSPVRPQAAGQEVPTAPTLSLSSDMQGAGSTAVISLTLRMPEGVTVGRAVSEVHYPKAFLEFHNVTRGLSAEAAQGEVKATPQPAVGDQGVLRVEVTTKGADGLPAGSLAELRFRILRAAKVDAKLVLANTATLWTDPEATQPIAGVLARNGEVKVTKTTLLPACFFYMH